LNLPDPIPLEEAQARLLALCPALAVEDVPVEQSLGRYLARPLLAARTQPPADLSAMDGYALTGEGPWQVIGESRCGAPYGGSIAAGQAVRISTGAILPAGANMVLLQEDATRDGDSLELSGDAPTPGRHIRREGFDFRAGDTVLPAGTLICPPQMALALSAGHAALPVRRRPLVAVLDSGDELAKDPANCRVDQIPASNGAMLAAMAREAGCEAKRIGPVADDLGALAEALAQAEEADVVVTSGGASVGDHDLVRPALEAWGAKIDFWRVAIKPGKPLMVARRGEQAVLGLPGNPVSSYVTAQLFLLPVLRTLAGALEPLPRRVTLPAACDMPAVGVRREFLRAHWDGQFVRPIEEQDSSALFSLSQANALIERPEDSAGVKAGTDVPVIPIRNG
jgi:molybdopterin molybdotransferase